MPLDQKTILDTVKQIKEKSEKRKFDQTVELVLNLREIDMKSPEAKIQELVELPHLPVEQANKICVIASRELALMAKKAGADRVIEKTELDGLAGKKRDLRKIAHEYDFFIAEAPLMPVVGRILGSVLGPKGKMPMPIPPSADIASVIEKNRKTIVVRMRTQPIVQCRVGVESMKEEELADNIQVVLRVLEGKLKRGTKNIKNIYIKTAMGTPVKIKA